MPELDKKPDYSLPWVLGMERVDQEGSGVIERLRNERGWSRDQVYDMSPILNPALQALIEGDYAPGVIWEVEQLVAYAIVFDMTPGSLLDLIYEERGREILAEEEAAGDAQPAVERTDLGGDRGLGQYGDTIYDTTWEQHKQTAPDWNGGSMVRVHDSSAAMEHCCWVTINGTLMLKGAPEILAGIPHGTAPGSASAHLNRQKAMQLRAHLDAWIATTEPGS